MPRLILWDTFSLLIHCSKQEDCLQDHKYECGIGWVYGAEDLHVNREQTKKPRRENKKESKGEPRTSAAVRPVRRGEEYITRNIIRLNDPGAHIDWELQKVLGLRPE